MVGSRAKGRGSAGNFGKQGLGAGFMQKGVRGHFIMQCSSFTESLETLWSVTPSAVFNLCE